MQRPETPVHKTQRTAGHAEKANRKLLNGLRCRFLKSRFGCGGRGSFGFVTFLNFNKRATFSGWITLTFFLNHTKINRPTNSPKPMATPTIIYAIQHDTQTRASQGQGLHIEKREPKAGYRANFKIAHMEENCNHLKILSASKQAVITSYRPTDTREKEMRFISCSRPLSHSWF